MKVPSYAALAILAAVAVPTVAQQISPHIAGPKTLSRPDASSSPSSKAFEAADQKMMRGMMVPISGDADRDFVAMMIPHHQGAVDMAKVELQYGKDPEMRRLAANIVNSQEKQIGQMDTWQAGHTAN